MLCLIGWWLPRDSWLWGHTVPGLANPALLDLHTHWMDGLRVLFTYPAGDASGPRDEQLQCARVWSYRHTQATCAAWYGESLTMQAKLCH